MLQRSSPCRSPASAYSGFPLLSVKITPGSRTVVTFTTAAVLVDPERSRGGRRCRRGGRRRRRGGRRRRRRRYSRSSYMPPLEGLPQPRPLRHRTLCRSRPRPPLVRAIVLALCCSLVMAILVLPVGVCRPYYGTQPAEAHSSSDEDPTFFRYPVERPVPNQILAREVVVIEEPKGARIPQHSHDGDQPAARTTGGPSRSRRLRTSRTLATNAP